MSVLDFPLERQQRIAAHLGMSYADWRVGVEKALAMAAAYKPTVRTHPPTAAEKARGAHIQARMDAETPSRFHATTIP